MSGYIMALVLTGIAAAIAELMSPSEKLAGHIRLVAGLCLLVALRAYQISCGVFSYRFRRWA